MHRSEHSRMSEEEEKNGGEAKEGETAAQRPHLSFESVEKSQAELEGEAYDLSAAIDHPMVKRYEPKFLALGGEHIVYEIPEHPDVVVKVEAETMRKIQRNNTEKGLPVAAMDPELLPSVQKFLSEGRRRHRRLVDYFGREHVLGLKQELVQVPVTSALLTELHGGTPPDGAREAKDAWAVVRVQKRAPEFSDPERQTVVAGYAEFREPDPETYGRITAALVEGNTDAHFTSKEFAEIFPGLMQDLLAKIDGDKGLQEMLKDFVRRTAKYTSETGEILDLAGRDNVTVFKKDGEWKYRLVDALYPGGSRRNMIEVAGTAADKSARGESLDEGEKNVLLNTINFVRTMNGLSERLGMKERISFIPDSAKGKIDFLTLLQRSEKGD